MSEIIKMLSRKKDPKISTEYSREDIAKILRTSPEALKEMEERYSLIDKTNDDLFSVSVKDEQSNIAYNTHNIDYKVTEAIVQELLSITPIMTCKNGITSIEESVGLPDKLVTAEELKNIPKAVRPQLTGTLMKRDTPEKAGKMLIYLWQKYQTTFFKEKQKWYDLFRQGLDIQDLDVVTYEILSWNPNAMGYWLPLIAPAVKSEGFFKIPDTKIIKVPLPLLQLTRTDELTTLTPATLKILDDFVYKVFNLEPDKEYFVKTGTFSSKFDFRNAYIHDPKEVNEMGEYLFFLSNQAVKMAGPLSKPCIYGASTTNEWVVREYIKDIEANPCIYEGMPLHTEYRVFVDFDNKEVLGIHPYWDPDIMKDRFENKPDSNSPKMQHDSLIFRMHEETLTKRYEENKEKVIEHIQRVVNDTNNLQGQWSIDVMQNNNDFYLIDMALAQDSAFNNIISKEKRLSIESLEPCFNTWGKVNK